MPSGLRPLQPAFWLDLDVRNARLPTELGLKRKILDVDRGGALALDREVQATHSGSLGSEILAAAEKRVLEMVVSNLEKHHPG